MTAFTPLPLPDLEAVADVDVLQLYLGMNGWRWRYCVAGVDQVEVLADGGQGYEHLSDAIAGAARVAGVGDGLLQETVSGRMHSLGRGEESTNVRLLLEAHR